MGLKNLQLLSRILSYETNILRSSSTLVLDKKYVYENYHQVKSWALEKPDEFWANVAREKLDWFKQFSKTSDCDLKTGKIRWFEDGQLNASYNCLDRHPSDNIAFIWEKDEPGQHEKVTFGELKKLTCQIGNALKGLGVGRGDRVAVYLPNSPMAAATMLACARIGAVHCVVFAGFSASSLSQRINDAQAKVVVTSDSTTRGGRVLPLKKIVDDAVLNTPVVEHVVVWNKMGGFEEAKRDPSLGKDVQLDWLLEQAAEDCEPERMCAEDQLFMLYTSGSTGKPKGLVHTTGGYLTYAAWSHELVFDWSPGDVYACVADVGWITGHSYVVYGPLANGATSVLFESTPTYPDPSRYWEMVERLKINQFYAAPTAIRLLLKSGDKFVEKHNLSSLKTLGTVGEPINREAWTWYHDVVGGNRCDVVDTWWQTETGGILISPRPSEPGAVIEPTKAMRPLPGIDAVLVDSSGDVMPEDGTVHEGSLCIAKPWPGMARTIWGDHDRFLSTYLSVVPGFYCSGDGAQRDERGFLRITGRLDDVINVSGVRLGTSEVEDAIDLHHYIAESAVIGIPHDIKGEGIHAFVTVKDHVTKDEATLRKEINQLVASEIAKFAVPDKMTFTNGLPKTRSGKIMRRILRKLSAGETQDLGDTSTLADPSVLQHLISKTTASNEKP